MRTQRPHHLFLLTIIFFTSTFSVTATGEQPPTTGNDGDTEFIRSSCNTTLYPDICYTSLSRYANAVQQNPGQLARIAIAVSFSKVHRTATYLSNLTRVADYGGNSRAALALHDCFSNLNDAVDEIRGSIKQMRQIGSAGAGSGASANSFLFQMSNVQTWMSAALTDEETCTDGFQDVENCPMKTDVNDRVTKVKKFTSNALALVNGYASKGTPFVHKSSVQQIEIRE